MIGSWKHQITRTSLKEAFAILVRSDYKVFHCQFNILLFYSPTFAMKNGKQVKGARLKKETNYDKAMKEAFMEIFENFKEIDKDINLKKTKQSVDFERRRGSAPAAALRQETAILANTKEELRRKFSTPVRPKPGFTEEVSTTTSPALPLPSKQTLSTMQWLLPCWEEEEEI